MQLYTMDEWKIFLEKLKKMSMLDENQRTLKRFFSGAATECEIDEHGRVLISPALRSYAKIDKEVILNGAIDHIEIWSKEVSEETNTYENINEIAKKLATSMNIDL